MPKFNLIEEPFIPCIHMDGRREDSNLKDVLMKAHEIAELRDGSPLVTIALHRLLLAILHRCYQGPKSANERIVIRESGRFDPARIVAYLTEFADRFDLFHEKFPFYQQRGFQIDDPSGINRIAQELACNNNPCLFDHTTNESGATITPAHAARAVVCSQAFGVGGGVSRQGNASAPIPNFTNGPLVAGAVTLICGNTLFETLWANLTTYDAEEKPFACDLDDAPVWEREPLEPHRDSPVPRGYLDYLTWQCRTLRLHCEEASGRIVVRNVSYAQGRRFKPEGVFLDPMFAFSRRDAEEPFHQVRFNEFRDLWRDSAALYQITQGSQQLDRAPTCMHTLGSADLASVTPQSLKLRISVYGLCINSKQAADVLFWRHETLPLPVTYLEHPELVEQLKRAIILAEAVVSESLRKAVWASASNRLAGDSGMKPDTDRVRSVVDSFAPERLYWSGLELPYRDLLVAFAEPTADREALIQRWFFDTLHPAVVSAFDNSIGRIDGGRDLKAATIGRSMLYRLLKKVQDDNRIPDR